MLLLIILTSLIITTVVTSTSITTSLGPIFGKTTTTTVKNQSIIVNVYLGVPYAATTGGANRFKNTQPRDKWTTPLNTTDYGPGCPQSDHNPDVPKIQSEDCLNLNIWIPSSVTTNSPIGVFFHGGAFKEGSNRGPFDLYDGAYFAARTNTIVITANYRLGALGFLTSNAAGSIGNYGLADQRAALQWVQNNAKAIGGDATKVTMWGESAGGMSGLVHMMSPLSKGLFSRIIMESNPASYIYRNVKEASDFGKGFVKDVNCDHENGTTATMNCLRRVNISTIAKATSTSNIGDIIQAVLGGAHLLDVFLPYTPTSGTANIPNFRISKNMKFANPVPLLLGTNRNEGATFILAALKSSLSKLEYNLLVDTIFGITGKDSYHIKERYPAQKDSRDSLGRLVTDYWFRCASQRVAGDIQTVLNASGVKNGVSMYWYNHSVSFGPEMWPKYNFPFCVDRVCHGAELPFVFHNSANWTLTNEELVLSDYIVDSWGSFIRHEDILLRNNGWPEYNDTMKNVMVLDVNRKIQSTIDEDELCSFWDGIGYDH